MRSSWYDGNMVRDDELANRAMTFAEAATLDPDRQAGELDGGRWVPVTKNTWLHGVVVSNVVMLLKLYARQSPKWRVAAGDPGTKLGHQPDILRGPDVGMVDVSRLPTGKGEAGWLEGSPELVVEVKGDSQSFSELTKKVFEYLGAGAQQVWVVDPHAETVVVFHAPDRVQLLGRIERLEGGAAFPGLSIPIAELFTR